MHGAPDKLQAQAQAQVFPFVFKPTFGVESNKQCHSQNHNYKKMDLYIIIIYLETIRELLQGSQANPIPNRNQSSLRKGRTHELPLLWESTRESVRRNQLIFFF